MQDNIHQMAKYRYLYSIRSLEIRFIAQKSIPARYVNAVNELCDD